MRNSHSNQLRMDCVPIEQISLNLECRDEIIPVLAGLQHVYSQEQLRDQLLELIREIARLSASKSATVKAGVYPAYGVLLERIGLLLDRVRPLQKAAQILNQSGKLGPQQIKWFERVNHWYRLVSQVVDTAFRRTQLGETVPNSDKLFSIFEPHTQLYRRGKAGKPNQFGRMALTYEDAAGFISHYYLMQRDESDAEVAVEQTQIAQRKHDGEIEDASFDRGFFSEANQTSLEQIVDHPCLPPRHRNGYAKWLNEASDRLLESRQRHSGVVQ